MLLRAAILQKKKNRLVPLIKWRQIHVTRARKELPILRNMRHIFNDLSRHAAAGKLV